MLRRELIRQLSDTLEDSCPESSIDVHTRSKVEGLVIFFVDEIEKRGLFRSLAFYEGLKYIQQEEPRT